MKRAASLVLISVFLLSILATIPPAIVPSQNRIEYVNLEEALETIGGPKGNLGINETAISQRAQEVMMSTFQENLGQVKNEEVLLYGRIPGGMIGFGVSRVFIWLEGADTSFIFEFVDANAVKPVSASVAPQKSNYFLGDRGTYTGVKSFTEIQYNGLWPGIDLIYRATPHGAKYEYQVSPEVDPSQILVRVTSCDELVVNRKSMRISISDVPFFDNGLVAFQNDDEVDVAFRLVDSTTFGFEVGPYDARRPLIIDPLLYSTYVGGNSGDGSTPDYTQFGLAVDSARCAYVCGITQSTNFPMVNPYNSTFVGPAGHFDSFVFKLNAAGDDLLYSTYISANDHDYARAIAVDSSGNAYITGCTESSDFPILNAYDSTHNFGRDPFVLKLNATGNGLVYSTYVGGSAFYETAFDILVDGSGYAYVVGYTEATNFPLVSAYDSTHNGGEDCFLFKLAPAGNSLVFSTFFGGSGDDFARGIDLDDYGNIYITGYTGSSNLPTVNAIDDTHNGGLDCFVAKFDSSASSLFFSTFLGGSSNSEGWGIGVDSLNQTYVSGITTSSDFPVSNAYDDTHNGGSDAFVLKLNSAGSGLAFSTFVGGSGYERAGSLALDEAGSVYVTGYTSSDTFPMANPTDSSYNSVDAFVLKFDASGQNLLYSTYVGGSGSDYAFQICVDDDGNAIVAGTTTSSDFPTVNAYDDTKDSSNDVFVFKLADMGDSDFDALPDYYEGLNGTDRYDPDCDSDNVKDGHEITLYGTDPLNASEPTWASYTGFSTLVGGSATDYPTGITVDQNGNVYVVGVTLSSDFPTLLGLNDTFNGGMRDTFVFKLSPDGGSLLFSTFIGGSGDDYGQEIAVDELMNVYITGRTQSLDFPTVNALIDWLNDDDCFVLKLNPSGDTLLFSTFVAGSSTDHPEGLVVDSAHNVYVAMTTWSMTDIPLVNAIDTVYDGAGTECYVFKLNSTGNGLLFSTYFGGNETEEVGGLAVDSAGSVYVTGRTESMDIPLKNAYDSHNAESDLFLFKLNSTGNGLVFSTYIGGDDYESACGVQVDSSGNIYVAGSAMGPTFPNTTTIGTSDYSDDIFVMKLNSTGNGLVFSTIVAGTDWEQPFDLAIDSSGAAYVSTPTDSVDLPVVNTDGLHAGNYDGYVMKLSPDGTHLEFSSYIGGSLFDTDPFLTLDSFGKLYITGRSDSSDFPFVNDYDSTNNGGDDVFVMRLDWSQDNDSDGIPDFWEDEFGLNSSDPSDASENWDADALTNLEEYLNGCDPTDDDSDDDTLSDSDEVNIYGTSPANNDTDHDAMPDNWELLNSLDPLVDDANGDLDADGASNLVEFQLGSDPGDSDTEDDLMPDGWEYDNGLDVLVDDAGDDEDTDGATNLQEFNAGTDPNNPDCDSDNLTDGEELYTYFTDPLDPDSDNDLLTDHEEVVTYGTNPLSPHSDSDIMPDGWEIQYGLNPLVNDSTGDPDMDSLLNEEEYFIGTDPQNPDTDSDDYLDGYEVHVLGTDPLDPNSPFVAIEPEFSTFIGGNNEDVFYDAIVDSVGNVYVTGYVLSTNFPIVGAYDSTHNGNWDVVVVKLNSTGNGILFSTYIGGSNSERGLEFYIGADFSVWLVGYTASSNFPTVNSYDSSFNGGWDGFISHLSANGSVLLYSTYLGGGSDDLLEYITVDEDGYVYCSGFTRSSNFPAVSGYDTSFNGDRDAIALKLSPDLQGLVYSTFIGGSGYDYTYGSRVTAGGDFIISGVTASSNFPVQDAFDSTPNGGDDIFVTRLNATGSGLVFSTYIGGSGEEYFGKFGLDEDENLLMGGSTMSTDFPTVNALNYTNNGGRDAFALKLASNGSVLYFSTYIGGSGTETVYGVATDQWNNIHLSGITTSTDLPVRNAFQNESQGMDDSFVLKINSTGNGLLYSTYLGGSADDGQRGMAIDQYGYVYIVGWTESSDHPVFNAYDDSLDGTSDGFVTCFRPLDDQDADGLPDEVEIAIGTDRFANDSDSDLMLDGWEYFNGLNPLVNDSDGDIDSDLLINYLEYVLGTDVNNNDTDSDLLIDGLEYLTYFSDPLDPDSDSDSVLDGLEVHTHGTSPTSNDTDFDLMPDGYEISNLLNPLLNDSMADNDTDWLVNLDEYTYGTDPFNPDTDSDSYLDGIEVHYIGSDPLDPLSSGLTPRFSTGYGGYEYDQAWAIKHGPGGEIYVIGSTYSPDFPVVNAYDSTYNSNGDCFIVKLTNDGQSILFSTYIGGSQSELPRGLMVDLSGNIVVVGSTQSSDFPLVNELYSSRSGYADCMIFKLNPTGDELLFSTYYGGDGYDVAGVVDIDESGSIYFAGETESADFPILNAYDSTPNGYQDIFLVALSPDGQDVDFSTYLGGSSEEAVLSLHLSSMGEIVVSGRTFSLDFPLANPIDDTLISSQDGFITRFDSSGQTLEFSTYLGGNEEDECHTIVDSHDNIYAVGSTRSTDFPVLNALYATNQGEYDLFVTKISASDQVEFSTYLGGSQVDICGDVCVDAHDRLHFTGVTDSPDFPTVDPFDAALNGNSDVFLCTFEASNTSIRYSSYVGGIAYDEGHGIDVDENGNAVITGVTRSADFPLYNPLYSIHGGSDYDAFVIKIPTVSDQDGDGLPDIEEAIAGTSPINPDSDFDLMPDGWEYYNGLNPLVDDSADDLDLDTLSNLFEFNIGTLPNSNDSDSDTMVDPWEYYNGLNPRLNDAGGDLDSDGLTNVQEYELNSNPNSGDTDSDLMPDLWEYTYGLNLKMDDAADDADSDGLLNLDEYLNGCDPGDGDTDSDSLGDNEEVVTYGTDPSDPDSDQDLLEDGYEVNELGSNPLSTDSDNDSLSDGFEVLQFGTDPTLPDTDFDTMSDYVEYLAGTDPLVPDADADADGDGVSNKDEWENGTDLFDPDTDNDGIPDLTDRNPLRYDVPLPVTQLATMGAIIAGSVVPALVMVLMNERMFRRSSSVDERRKRDSESEREEE